MNKETKIIKQLTINFGWSDNFKENFKELEKDFLKLHQNEDYSVQIYNLDCGIKSKQVFELLFMKPKPNLTEFELCNIVFPSQEFKLFTCSSWPNLESLRIDKSKIDYESAILLSKCHFPSLYSVELVNHSIDDEIVEHICKADWPSLKILNLSINKLSSKALQYLGSAQWKELEKLLVYKNKFSHSVYNIKEFCFPKLKQINLSKKENILDDSSFKEENLSRMIKENQPLIEFLDVEGCLITGKQLFDLNSNFGWQNMKQLRMGSFDKLSQDKFSIDLSNVCQFYFPHLQKLEISNTFLSKRTVTNFSKSCWNELSRLTLKKCGLLEDSVFILSKCNWKLLNELGLVGNEINDTSINFLHSANWSSLEELLLRNWLFENTTMTIVGVLSLAKMSNTSLKSINLSKHRGLSTNVLNELYQ